MNPLQFQQIAPRAPRILVTALLALAVLGVATGCRHKPPDEEADDFAGGQKSLSSREFRRMYFAEGVAYDPSPERAQDGDDLDKLEKLITRIHVGVIWKFDLDKERFQSRETFQFNGQRWSLFKTGYSREEIVFAVGVPKRKSDLGRILYVNGEVVDASKGSVFCLHPETGELKQMPVHVHSVELLDQLAPALMAAAQTMGKTSTPPVTESGPP